MIILMIFFCGMNTCVSLAIVSLVSAGKIYFLKDVNQSIYVSFQRLINSIITY